MTHADPTHSGSAPGKKITVLICDDHPTFRDGLRAGLDREQDLEVVGEASDGEHAVALARRLAPMVVLMDLGMPKLGGVEATKRIKAERPETMVLPITADEYHRDVMLAVAAGANGYVLKDTTTAAIADNVRQAAAGHFPTSPRAAAPLYNSIREPSHLTDEEIAVLQLIADGETNEAINKRFRSEGHVGRVLKRVNKKLDTKDRTSAAIEALRRGEII